MIRLAESDKRPSPKSLSNDNGRAPSPLTASQRRAILAIAKRWDRNVDYECRKRFATEFDDLSVRQASDLIDHLKLSTPSGKGCSLGLSPSSLDEKKKIPGFPPAWTDRHKSSVGRRIRWRHSVGG